ncbi:MAG: TIGR00730 family Rossman fold protein [Bacteroidetes bacterium]|nr:TIGR00730 family Rossman fold protein [Bacteroidota bacterium]
MTSPKHEEERAFLEGPHSRTEEFIFTMKVVVEFIRGFRKFHFLGPCATVFGSARFPPEHPYYQLAQKIGGELAKLGFTVMTGGGPGVMEAANRGAKEAGGKSVGCNIILQEEQKPNPYLDRWVKIDYFFLRKVLLNKYSYAFIVMPGGYGTLDEFFESLTLIQTDKIRHFPVILFGKEHHAKLYEHLQLMVKIRTITDDDLKLFLFTDSVPEAISFLNEKAVKYFGLAKFKRNKPLRILGEE